MLLFSLGAYFGPIDIPSDDLSYVDIQDSSIQTNKETSISAEEKVSQITRGQQPSAIKSQRIRMIATEQIPVQRFIDLDTLIEVDSDIEYLAPSPKE